MFNESPRMAAFLASGLTILALGVGGTAMASGQPAPGTVGHANWKGTPQGQAYDLNSNDGNSGWRCDANGGAGGGNPAQPMDCGVTMPPPPGQSGDKTNNGGNPGNGPTLVDGSLDNT